jgi:hypothetical protein
MIWLLSGHLRIAYTYQKSSQEYLKYVIFGNELSDKAVF